MQFGLEDLTNGFLLLIKKKARATTSKDMISFIMLCEFLSYII